jgi:hypothetical protein
MNDFFRFSCPSCGNSLKAKAEQAGKKAHCTKCDVRLVVPTQPDRMGSHPSLASASGPAATSTEFSTNKTSPKESPTASPFHNHRLLVWVSWLVGVLALANVVIYVIIHSSNKQRNNGDRARSIAKDHDRFLGAEKAFAGVVDRIGIELKTYSENFSQINHTQETGALELEFFRFTMTGRVTWDGKKLNYHVNKDIGPRHSAHLYVSVMATCRASGEISKPGRRTAGFTADISIPYYCEATYAYQFNEWQLDGVRLRLGFAQQQVTDNVFNDLFGFEVVKEINKKSETNVTLTPESADFARLYQILSLPAQKAKE